MPVFKCHDCAEMHSRKTKRVRFTGYGTCSCICSMCDSEGRTICPSCGGTGKSGLFGRRCKQCAGERTVVCAKCKGLLGDPECPVCNGTSCETCRGTRRVDLEAVLAKLKSTPRRTILFRPTGSLRPAVEMEFPVFTCESAWKRLAPLIDADPQLTVCREEEGECLHLAGKLDGDERSYYAIYRFGENEYGIEESFSHLESAGASPLMP
jgi:hypothetical protein